MKDLIEQYGKGLVIKKDELTAIERMKLFDEGKPIDRIPCCLDTGETMAPLMGLSIDDYYHSSQLMCDLEVYLYENFHSMVPVFPPHCAGWQKQWVLRFAIMTTTLHN